MKRAHKLKAANVAVVGGLGFIGSNLAIRCLELGARVTIYDSILPRSGGNFSNISGFEPHMRVIQDDIRNLEGVCLALRGQDYVFNCAAHTSHPYSMKDPCLDIDINCRGVVTLLEALRKVNPDARVVSLGTATQCGAMQSSIIDEMHPEFPLDIYSANKSVGEKYHLIYHTSYGMRTTVLRLCNVFGPRAGINSPDLGVCNYFVGRALEDAELTVFGDGLQRRHVTYVGDCVETILATACEEDCVGKIFFGSGNSVYSLKEYAHRVVKNFGTGTVKQVPWPVSRKNLDAGDILVSNARLVACLGEQVETSLDEGLRLTQEYFANRTREYLTT